MLRVGPALATTVGVKLGVELGAVEVVGEDETTKVEIVTSRDLPKDTPFRTGNAVIVNGSDSLESASAALNRPSPSSPASEYGATSSVNTSTPSIKN